MTTAANNKFPEIDWELGDFEYADSGLKYYCCSGESDDGRLWTGRGAVHFDTLIEVDDIEEEN